LVAPFAARAAEPAERPDPTGDLYAWYRFEDASDLARNVGAHALPASLPAVGVSQVDGRIGKALLLDGARGHGLQIPYPSRIFGEEAERGTVMLWVRPSFEVASDTREQVLFDFTPRTGNTLVDGHEIVAVMTGEKFRVQPQLGAPVMRLETPLAKGVWTHLALTWDAKRGAAFYVNGKLAAQRQHAFKPVKLGRFSGWIGHHGTCGRPFDGAVDEVRLFNRMLEADEIAPLTTCDPQPRLTVSKWRRDGAEVVNEGDAPVEVWPRFFRTNGSRLTAGPPQTIPPGQSATVPWPDAPPTLRRERRGIMAGKGNAAVECDGRIYAGLSLRLAPPKRVFFSDEPPVLGLDIAGDLPETFKSRLTATIADWDGKPLRTPTPLRVKVRPGKTAGKTWALGKPLPIGAYRLTVSAELRDGTAEQVAAINLVSTKREGFRDIFSVATTFCRKTDENRARARADGVTVLRAGASYTPDMRYYDELTDALGRLGLKNYPNVNPIRACPVDRALPGVQGSSRYACLSHPQALAAMRDMAHGLADYYLYNPVTPTVFVEGELPYHPPDYSPVSTQAFQDWLRRRYGTLEALNASWKSQYKSWSELEQIGSPKDVDAAAHNVQWMKLELPKAMADRYAALAKVDRTRAIEWRRWHQSVINNAYRTFADAFHQRNRVTGLGTNPCWPNFAPEVLFFWSDIFTLAGLDPYLPGRLPQDLGYPSELLESIDLTVSAYQGKPLWVNELYDLSTYPAGVPEAQGWCLVGHGCSLPTYFTYDYYYEGQRGGKPLEFGLFDKQGKPYATYPSFRKFTAEVHAFHARYDAHSLRREHPRVALFLADANGTAGWLETGGRTWSATAVLAHIGAYWLTRQAGQPVEFFNETRWNQVAGAPALIVPWTELVRQADLERVIAFAEGGGTVILDGPVGTHNELWQPVSPQPGGAALAELGVSWQDWKREKNRMIAGKAGAALGLVAGTEIPCLGKPVKAQPGAMTVLAADPEGAPLLLHARLGQGQLYWLLANLGREHRKNQPAPEAVALWRAMLASAGLAPHVELVTSKPSTPEAEKTVCDVTLRLKGDDTAFLFVVSFLGPTKGALRLNLPPGTYEAVEARTQQPVPLAAAGDAWEIPVDLPAFGTSVYRVRSQTGPVFAGW